MTERVPSTRDEIVAEATDLLAFAAARAEHRKLELSVLEG